LSQVGKSFCGVIVKKFGTRNSGGNIWFLVCKNLPSPAVFP